MQPARRYAELLGQTARLPARSGGCALGPWRSVLGTTCMSFLVGQLLWFLGQAWRRNWWQRTGRACLTLIAIAAGACTAWLYSSDASTWIGCSTGVRRGRKGLRDCRFKTAEGNASMYYDLLSTQFP